MTRNRLLEALCVFIFGMFNLSKPQGEVLRTLGSISDRQQNFQRAKSGPMGSELL